MALILITVNDTPEGPQVGVVSEPPIRPGGDTVLTPAQVVALNMLDALKAEPVKEDRGLIQLLTPDEREDFPH